jgi:hypothetical protein
MHSLRHTRHRTNTRPKDSHRITVAEGAGMASRIPIKGMLFLVPSDPY